VLIDKVDEECDGEVTNAWLASSEAEELICKNYHEVLDYMVSKIL
jgi:hypothetical protein